MKCQDEGQKSPAHKKGPAGRTNNQKEKKIKEKIFLRRMNESLSI
jgi:hypothetical protein